MNLSPRDDRPMHLITDDDIIIRMFAGKPWSKQDGRWKRRRTGEACIAFEKRTPDGAAWMS